MSINSCEEDNQNSLNSNSSIPSLMTLPFDCRIAIFQCVPNLSDIACTCRQLRHERDHPSLDPTRTSLKHMKDALGRTGFPLELQLTSSSFVIPTDFSRYSHLVRQWSLPQVRLLDLSNRITEDEDTSPKRVDISVLMFLAMVLPNLLEIDLTGMQTNQFSLSFLSWKSPQLRCIYWNAAGVDQPASGLHLSACHNLQELYLDDCIFSIIGDDEERMFGEPEEEDRNDDDDTLFRCCRSQLQRVSLRNAMYRVYDDKRQIKPFTQSCLMRFVRVTPTLRWFCSDLTPDNCRVLQQERPSVLFA